MKSCIVIYISLKFIPIDSNSSFVQLMACHLLGARPLSEPMLTDIYDAMYELTYYGQVMAYIAT